MHQNLEKLFREFGNKFDSTTRTPLFTGKAWAAARAVVEGAHTGAFSDPIDVPLYTKVGRDRHGLDLFHCSRGTNGVRVAGRAGPARGPAGPARFGPARPGPGKNPGPTPARIV